MVLEPVILGIAAAGAGVVFRYFSGVFAERTGHSKREGENAAGTAGISLIAQRKHDGPPALRH